jgi:uncharacterized lipoprotein YddW (UPF0748 family)
MKILLFLVFTISNILGHTQNFHKGVWVANVGQGQITHRDSAIKLVSTCAKVGITDIYFVCWNRGFTLYKSKTMKKLFGYEIDTLYKNIDPMQVLIEEAHKKNIKVHAWFEFGFSSAYRNEGAHILKVKPQWAALDIKGNVVVKNGFYWMNGFDKKVQRFIQNLIFDLLKNYDVDGIQGDDRLPALPSEAGYNKPFVKRFKSKYKVNDTPSRNDSLFTRYRVEWLNNFMKKLYTEVKKFKPNCIVSMSPSPYPWSVQEYLQDWPTWLKNNFVDYVIVQLYRYDIESYKKVLRENRLASGDLKHKMYAGILTSLANGYLIKEDLLEKKRQLNQQFQLRGECYFYYGGIELKPEMFLDKK